MHVSIHIMVTLKHIVTYQALPFPEFYNHAMNKVDSAVHCWLSCHGFVPVKRVAEAL